MLGEVVEDIDWVEAGIECAMPPEREVGSLVDDGRGLSGGLGAEGNGGLPYALATAAPSDELLPVSGEGGGVPSVPDLVRLFSSSCNLLVRTSASNCKFLKLANPAKKIKLQGHLPARSACESVSKTGALCAVRRSSPE